MVSSGLGFLFCLGHEVYGRWHTAAVDLLVALAQEHARGLPSCIKQGLFLSRLKRWSGSICVSLQNTVADGINFAAGGHISAFPLEPAPTLSSLFHD